MVIMTVKTDKDISVEGMRNFVDSLLIESNWIVFVDTIEINGKLYYNVKKDGKKYSESLRLSKKGDEIQTKGE